MKNDLETLKNVKFAFDIQSDHSARCNGYQTLCKMIAEEELNLTRESISNQIKQSCSFYESDNTSAMNCINCGKGKWTHLL